MSSSERVDKSEVTRTTACFSLEGLLLLPKECVDGDTATGSFLKSVHVCI